MCTPKDFTVETCFIGNWLIVAVGFVVDLNNLKGCSVLQKACERGTFFNNRRMKEVDFLSKWCTTG